VSVAVGTCLILSACSTPRLHSGVVLPPQFTAAKAQVEQPEVVWWERYGDPVLADLIARAARENRDIRMAAERVRAARAGVTVTRSAMLPNIGASANASRSDSQYTGLARQLAPDTRTVAGGLSVSWELDVSGRLRAASAAASADARASEDYARGVKLLVLTDVASNYFTLAGAQRQLDTVKAIAAAHDETLRLVTARQRVGMASPFDVERARTEASRAQSAIPPLETLIAVSGHRLAVLIGDQPAAAARLATWNGPTAVPQITPGQPAQLLERRPDLLVFRSQLDAANLRRRQAATEWFPRLFTTALFGRQSLDVNGIDLGAARFGNAAALLAMPILDWGRTKSINEMAKSAQSEALLKYEDAIVRALEDVENGLVAFREEGQRLQVLRSAADSASAAFDHADSLYKRGQIDLLPLLDAQRGWLAVQISANDSHTQLMLDSVHLFKALGGGWDNAPQRTSTSSSSTLSNPIKESP
jgi:multidrug efflux system outer membrane protein